jgi:hypothetical protein
MKIKSPIGYLGLWSAFLAVGSWTVPTSVGIAVSAGTVMAAAPVDSDGASAPPILVLTTSDNPDLIQELGLQMAEREGLEPEQSEVVSIMVSPEVAEHLSAAVVVDGGVEGRNPVDGDGKPLPPPSSFRLSRVESRGTGNRSRAHQVGQSSGSLTVRSHRPEAVSPRVVGTTSTSIGMSMTDRESASVSSRMARRSAKITFRFLTCHFPMCSPASIGGRPLSTIVWRWSQSGSAYSA